MPSAALTAILLTPSYCPEAKAAFAAMTTQPSAALKRLYDNGIRSLIAAGIWTKLDALYLMNVETAQAARVNIKNPGTYDLTAANSPTFTAKSGYAGNGSSAYLDTNLNPTTATSPKFTRDSATLFAWSLKSGTDAGATAGMANATGASVLYPRYTDGNSYSRLNSAANMVVASADGTGLLHVNRSTSAADQTYKNGSSIATDTAASAALTNANLAFLRETTNYFSGTVAMGGFGQSLSSQEASNLYTALNNFKTGVDAL